MASSLLENLTDIGGAFASTDLVYVAKDAGGSFVDRKAAYSRFTTAFAPAGSYALTTNPLSQFAATTSAQLAATISDETGTGALVFATNPVLVTPNLGTPSAINLINATGFPAALFGNPTASVGLVAVNGVATTAMRSDGAPALSQTIAPTWTGLHTFSPAANAIGLVISGYSVTGAGTATMLDMSGTWNTSGSPTAIKLNITRTAVGSSALLMDLQEDTISRFQVQRDGFVNIIRQEADTIISGIALQKRGTTGDATAAITSGSNIASFDSKGWDGSAFGTASLIRIFATETWTGSAHGARMVFSVPAIGAVTVPTILDLRSIGLGVGGIAPVTELTVASVSAADPRGIMTAQYSADTVGARFHFRKSRGATVGTDTVIVSGDTLGQIRFSGYDGTNYIQTASIRAVSSGTIAATRVASSLIFATGTDAAPTVLTDRLTITSTGLTYIDGGNGLPSIGRNTSTATYIGWFGNHFALTDSSGSFNFYHSTASLVTLIGSTTSLGWMSVSFNGTAGDVFLRRDAAAVLALSNTTVAAQTFRIYETTDAGLTNYSRLSMATAAGNHLIRTEAAGTGTLRILQVGTGPKAGTDIAGINAIFHGGQSTGTGLGGSALIQASPAAGGTGSGVNALVTRFEASSVGIGFFAATPIAKPTGGENVTNSVTDTASTAGTIPDITNGTVYATDFTNLRNALFQLARMLKQDHDALRAYGLLT